MERRDEPAGAPADGPVPVPTAPAPDLSLLVPALLGSLGLAIAWMWGGETAPHFLVTALAAYALVAAQARDRMPRVLVSVGIATLALFWLLETVDLTWDITVPTLLKVEWVLAFFPVGALFVLLRGTDLALHGVFPRTARVLALALLGAGTIVRWGEILILNHPSTTIATVQYALREDLACVLWGFGALATAAGFTFQVYAVRVSRARAARRVPLLAAGAAVLVAASFMTVSIGAVAEAKMTPGPLLNVGVHTNDVRNIDPRLTPYAHLEVTWDRVETRQGAFNWTYYDEQFEEANRRGVGLYLLVNTYPPPWLVERYPSAVMVDQWGNPFTWADEAPGTPRTRIWDLSFEHPGVMRAKTGFLQEALQRYGSDPAVRFVSIQNEPSYPHDFNLLRFASYDPHTVAAFRAALHTETDGDLDLLRERYGVAADSWTEVEPPKVPGSALWDRWQRFREDSLVNFVHTLAETARHHTAKPVTAKLMAHFLTRFAAPHAGLSEHAVRGIVDAVDVVSLDIYPASAADLERTLQYYQHLAGGKPLVVAEFNLLLGVNLPTSGATLLRALTVLERYTDYVFLFTEDHHYLYGLNFEEGALAYRVLELYRMPGWDPRVTVAMFGLVKTDAMSLLNVYPAYVTASEVLTIPVVPWPFLALAIVPAIPTGNLSPRVQLVLRVGAVALLLTLGYLHWAA